MPLNAFTTVQNSESKMPQCLSICPPFSPPPPPYALFRRYDPPPGTELLLSRVLRGDTTPFPESAPSWSCRLGDVVMIVLNNLDGGEVRRPSVCVCVCVCVCGWVGVVEGGGHCELTFAYVRLKTGR